MAIIFKKFMTIPDVSKPGVFLYDDTIEFDSKVGIFDGVKYTKESLCTFEVFGKNNKQLNIMNFENFVRENLNYENEVITNLRNFLEDKLNNIIKNTIETILNETDNYNMVNNYIEFLFEKHSVHLRNSVGSDQLINFFWNKIELAIKNFIINDMYL